MKIVPLIQFGLGGVGRALVRRVLDANDDFEWRYGIRFLYVALSDSRGAAVAAEGFSYAQLMHMLTVKASGGSLADSEWGYKRGELTDLVDLAGTEDAIVIDVTASDETVDALLLALERGYGAALANKKPLTGPYRTFRHLTASGRCRYESTVGAGVPVIATLSETIIPSHDPVHHIQGCFSGTLGFLTTGLEAGRSFSQLVAEARTRGYTEPDPRDDLSGMDVARKALILARTLGWPLEMEQIPVEPLFPPEMAQGSVAEFMTALPRLDEAYAQQMAQARAQNHTLRYVARIEAGETRVGLQEVPLDSALGQLRGSDNLVAFHTQVYAETPLVLQGRGAGVDGTAAGVLADLVALARS